MQAQMSEKKRSLCTTAQNKDAPVDHRLCEMFWTLGPGFSRWAESHLRQHGHTPQRMRLMSFLYKNGPVKMGDLRNELGVTATSITALVDVLEKEGMVSRKPHATDRRATLIKLTAKAEKQLTELCGPFKDQVSKIFAVFSKEEQKIFLHLLSRMRDELVERHVLEEARL
jgi:DNA-binding MarR family transcriptional regulator